MFINMMINLAMVIMLLMMVIDSGFGADVTREATRKTGNIYGWFQPNRILQFVRHLSKFAG